MSNSVAMTSFSYYSLSAINSKLIKGHDFCLVFKEKSDLILKPNLLGSRCTYLSEIKTGLDSALDLNNGIVSAHCREVTQDDI